MKFEKNKMLGVIDGYNFCIHKSLKNNIQR